MFNKKVTLQAKRAVILSSGSYGPGEVFKCSEAEAAFLLKSSHALKIGKSGEKVTPDSKEKTKVIKLSKREKAKAERISKNKIAKSEEDIAEGNTEK